MEAGASRRLTGAASMVLDRRRRPCMGGRGRSPQVLIGARVPSRVRGMRPMARICTPRREVFRRGTIPPIARQNHQIRRPQWLC